MVIKRRGGGSTIPKGLRGVLRRLRGKGKLTLLVWAKQAKLLDVKGSKRQ